MLLTGLYALQLLLTRGGWRGVCFAPALVVFRLQAWRLVTAHLFHAGLLHLALNLAAFIPLGARLERGVGTVRVRTRLCEHGVRACSGRSRLVSVFACVLGMLAHQLSSILVLQKRTITAATAAASSLRRCWACWRSRRTPSPRCSALP